MLCLKVYLANLKQVIFRLKSDLGTLTCYPDSRIIDVPCVDSSMFTVSLQYLHALMYYPHHFIMFT